MCRTSFAIFCCILVSEVRNSSQGQSVDPLPEAQGHSGTLRVSFRDCCASWIGQRVALHAAPFGARVDAPGATTWARFARVVMQGAGVMNLWCLDDIWWIFGGIEGFMLVELVGFCGIPDFSDRVIWSCSHICTATAFAQANFQWGIVGLKVWQGIQIFDPQRQLWDVIPVSWDFFPPIGGFPT